MHIIHSVLFLAVFLIFITVLVVLAPVQAADRPGYIGSGTFMGDGSETDYSIPPYLNDATTPINAQWDIVAWDPSRWGADDSDKGGTIMSRFYASGLVTDQDMDDDVPVLEVGDLFLRLSDGDKGRFLETIDALYGITRSAAAGSFVVEHDRTNDIIAVYGKHGIQLQ